MLNLILKPHRSCLKAGTSDIQKLFVMLKLIPRSDVAVTRPPLAIALVIDTSGSMRDGAPLNKLEQAITAAHFLIDDGRFSAGDQITVIRFDDDAQTMLPLTPFSQKRAAHEAVNAMREYSGGTQMAKGMSCAQVEMARLPASVAKRVVVLTDGRTVDEEKCRILAHDFGSTNTPLVTIGIDVEYNEGLLRDLADTSGGRPYHLQSMKQLREILGTEVASSVKEVVTDVQATLSLVKGVQLDSVTRVYPSLAEVGSSAPLRLGNIAAGDYTVFVLEFTITGFERPASRARIAQIGLSGHIPGLGRRDELAPQDLYVTFTPDESATLSVEDEVLGYVQQKNVDRLVQQAVRVAGTDTEQARSTLQTAVNMTQRLGNIPVSQMLESALDELKRTGSISPGTSKTVSLNGRTRTMKTGSVEDMENVPTEEEIRRLTGA